MTGRYQQRLPRVPQVAARTAGLPLTESTIAQRLKAVGYATGAVGKWHLGKTAEYHPQQRGFDEFFGFLGGLHPIFPMTGRSR